jgi:hypothetical protein
MSKVTPGSCFHGTCSPVGEKDSVLKRQKINYTPVAQRKGCRLITEEPFLAIRASFLEVQVNAVLICLLRSGILLNF